ncbi:MAG TPA: hypothetical protein VH833_07870 [Gemmatimonadales bacterium]|jgi:hypothetical protein
MSQRCAAVLGALFLCACGAGVYGKVQELRSDTIRGDSIRVIVVIAGENESSDRQLAGRVREQLNEAGFTAVRRQGTWESEETALADICPLGQPSDTHGVLFVWWNQLDLRHCATHRRAYQIQAGYRGVDYMFRRLLRYLNPRSNG